MAGHDLMDGANEVANMGINMEINMPVIRLETGF